MEIGCKEVALRGIAVGSGVVVGGCVGLAHLLTIAGPQHTWPGAPAATRRRLPMRADSAVAAWRSHGGGDFEEFFDAEYPRVVAYCLAFGLARPAAEDIAQEAFLTVLRRWETITNLPAYLRRVAFHLAIRRRYEIPHDDLATSQAVARPDTPSPLEERHVVLEALRQLPSQQQAVFALFFDDQPIPDIAEALDMPAATVRSHLRHARRRLGVWWRRHGDGSHAPEGGTR